MAIDTDKLEALHEAATKDWRFDQDWHRLPSVIDADGRNVATMEKLGFPNRNSRTKTQEANAAIITYLRNAVPDILNLLASVEQADKIIQDIVAERNALAAENAALTEKVERLEEVLDDIKYQAQTRITDGDEMGGRIWRIALVDILAEAIAALKEPSQ